MADTSIPVFTGKIMYSSSREVKIEFVSGIEIPDGSTMTLIQILGKNDVFDVVTIPYDQMEVIHTIYIDDNRFFDAFSYDFRAEIRTKDNLVVCKIKLKTVGFTPDYRIRGIARTVIHDFRVVAKRMNGSIVYVFKKMKLMDKCQECWDEDLSSSTNSNCKKCGGLGRISYYSNPIETYAGPIRSSNDSLNLVNVGQESGGSSTISMLQEITMFTDDIFFFRSTGKWYIVNASISASTIQNIPTLQTLAVSEIPSGATQIDMAKRNEKFIDKFSNRMR